MSLNPYAVAFSPRSTATRDVWLGDYTGWGLHGRSTRNSAPEYSSADYRPGPSLSLIDLPPELLGEVIARVRDPLDLAALSLTCRAFSKEIRTTPLHLSLRLVQPDLRQSFLRSIPKQHLFRGLRVLDLSECDELPGYAIVAAIESLPELQHLDTANCRGLSKEHLNDICNLVADRNSYLTSGGKARKFCGVRSLALQRCYKLDVSSLSSVLQAASSPASKLETATFSLLNFLAWPFSQHPQSLSSPRSVNAHSIPSGSLKILVLNNCSKLAGDSLAYLAACCPDLHHLYLGGTVIEYEAPDLSMDQPMMALAIQATENRASMKSDRARHKKVEAQASTISEPLSTLSKLEVLELTFFDPAVIAHIAGLLPNVQVWNFLTTKDLRAARDLLAAAKKEKRPLYAGYKMAMSAAIDCYSSMGACPLHLAVMNDQLENLQLAVGLGACLEKKDNTGATPLFAACEHHRDKLAQFLINAGAVLTTRNRGDEAPLYIAALKGHETIVKLLLRGFEEREIEWIDEKKYGDGWNPLMAAALTDLPETKAVAHILLRAAGHKAEHLAMLRNRYGQTAAHLAARKGNHLLVAALLKAAGNKLAMAQDHNNNTPLDIAKLNARCELALALLTRAKDDVLSQGRSRHSKRRQNVPSGHANGFPRSYDHRPVTVRQ